MASDNLIPFSERSKEEASEMGRKGGIASGETRRKKKTMRDTLQLLLDETDSKTGKTYRELVTIGLFKGAARGNAINYRTILETLGELKPDGENENNNGVINELVEALNNVKKD